jgi:hypothetical protein
MYVANMIAVGFFTVTKDSLYYIVNDQALSIRIS